MAARRHSRWEYGPADQVVTITLNSLGAGGGARQSLAIDNSVDGFIDAIVSATIKSGGAAAGGNANYCSSIFVWGAMDLAKLPDGITGTDAGFTAGVAPLEFAAVISGERSGFNPVLNKTNTGIFSVARALGGALPKYWGLIVVNDTKTTLAASGHALKYQGVRRGAYDA